MPKVRASSGTMGTMSLPISGSFSILRSMRDESHGGGNFAAIAAVVKFLEEFVVIGGERLGADFALRNVAAERLAARCRY